MEKPILAFSSITSSVLRKVLPPEEKKIKKYLSLIKELIRNSEKDGTMGIKSHAGLFKGEYLPHLQVTNSIKTGSAFPQKLELGLYSNTSVWELRKLIGERVSRAYASHDGNGAYIQETPCHPASIRIYRHTGCTDLKDQENGKTLAELKFKPNEQLTAYRRTIFPSAKVSLLNEDGTDLCDKAKDIFT